MISVTMRDGTIRWLAVEHVVHVSANGVNDGNGKELTTIYLSTGTVINVRDSAATVVELIEAHQRQRER